MLEKAGQLDTSFQLGVFVEGRLNIQCGRNTSPGTRAIRTFPKPGTTKPSLYVNRSTPDYFKIVISSNEFSTSFHGGHLKRDSSTQQEVY